MIYHFKVKFGFGKMDFVSVKNEEVEKAIYAQLKKIPVKLGSSYINGSNIVSITPHYHKYTGWYDTYEPRDSDDMKQIERDCPKGFDQVLLGYQDRVRGYIEKGNVNLIGNNQEVPAIEHKEDDKREGGMKGISDLIKPNE